jgi:hypothetical protein
MDKVLEIIENYRKKKKVELEDCEFEASLGYIAI